MTTLHLRTYAKQKNSINRVTERERYLQYNQLKTFFYTSLLECNCFTVLCQFLLYNKVNQLYVYILPISPPSEASLPHSLSHFSRSSQGTELISLCYAATSHQLSILHLVVYICQCCSVTTSQPPLLPLCPQVCSLRLRLYSCPDTRFISTIFLDSIYLHQHTVFVFLFLTYFTLYDRLQVHPPHYK